MSLMIPQKGTSRKRRLILQGEQTQECPGQETSQRKKPTLRRVGFGETPRFYYGWPKGRR